MWHAFINGLQSIRNRFHLAGLVYGSQLLLALFIGVQISDLIESSIGTSLELEKMLSGFDYTVYQDFMNEYGERLAPITSQLSQFAILYMLISVFLNAGLLSSIGLEKNSLKDYGLHGAQYFLSFLKIALVFGGIWLIWTVVLVVPLLTNLFPALETMSSEKSLLALMLLCLFIHLIGTAFLLNSSVFARLYKIKQRELSIPKVIGRALKQNFRHFFRINSLFLLFVLLQAVLIGIYLLLEGSSGMTSPMTIVLFVLIQQLFSYARICWRIMWYGGMNALERGIK